MKVYFDVHGANLAEVTEAAEIELATFTNTSRDELRLEWDIDIEVQQEATTAQGQIALWRGEVTARR
jgi:hypothetical protein